jgi:hypothetical protein
MKMLNKIVGSSVGVAAALALSASSLQAQNLLVNPNFDTAQYTANPITPSTANQGWATFGAVGPTNMFGSPVDSPLSAPDALLEQNAAGNAWNPAGAYQITDGLAEGGSITPGDTYTLSVWEITDTGTTHGASNSAYATPVDLNLQFNGSLVTNTLTEVTSSPGNNSFSALNGSPIANNANQWIQYSVTAVAPAGSQYALVYLMFMDNGNNLTTDNMYFDNASLTQVVPEPSSLALAGMGLVSSFFLIRRRNS